MRSLIQVPHKQYQSTTTKDQQLSINNNLTSNTHPTHLYLLIGMPATCCYHATAESTQWGVPIVMSPEPKGHYDYIRLVNWYVVSCTTITIVVQLATYQFPNND